MIYRGYVGPMNKIKMIFKKGVKQFVWPIVIFTWICSSEEALEDFRCCLYKKPTFKKSVPTIKTYEFQNY
jgi:hypothetical protein